MRHLKALWGRTEPLAILGLKDPDFVLVADAVFGSDPEVWDVLLETIKALCESSTLMVIANVRWTRYLSGRRYMKSSP